MISSRPFDEGLETHLTSHKPYVLKNEEQREIPYFISIYGFKKQQFNHWLNNTLDTYPNLNMVHPSDFSTKVEENIKNYKGKDIYQLLQDNKTLIC